MRRRGFTLIEILCVVVIVGLLATIAVVSYVEHLRSARIRTTQASLKILAAQVSAFYLEYSRYPDALEDLVRRPASLGGKAWRRFMDELPRDGWDRDFRYRLPGPEDRDFDIVSRGEDGQEGTVDDLALVRRPAP